MSVIRPDDRDPLAQSEDRTTRRLRIPTSVGPNNPSSMPIVTTPIPEGTRAEEVVPLSPTEELVAEAATLAEGQEPFDSTVAPDYILPSIGDTEGPVPGMPGLRLRPINYENPVVPDVAFENDADAWNRIRDQAVSEAYSDDIIFSQTVRERVGASNAISRSSGDYAPTLRPDYSYILRDTLAEQEERRQAYQNATRAPGVNPEQGMLGVGRNVLQGRPFSRISTQVIEDSFSRLAEDGEYQTRIGRFIRNRVPDSPGNFLERAALAAATPGRALNMAIDLGADRQRIEQRLLEENDEYRTLGRRALDELRTFVTRLQPTAANRGAGMTRFRSTTEASPLLEALAEESPAFRQLMTELGPTLDQRGALQTNPLRGNFGEFGNAGAFSAAMYLLNITGGAFTGAVYEAANSTRDLLARVNPSWSREGLSYTPSVFSPFAGVDIGFTQQYTPDRYLSTIGNPALRGLPRGGQIALGFALDVAADPDGLIMRPTRNILSKAGRRTITGGAAVDSLSQALDNAVRNVDLPSPTFAASLSQVVVRPTTEGVRSAATTAVMPTVRRIDAPSVSVEVPIRSTRRAASRGGNIVTVEDLLNRVEMVTRQIDQAPPVRQAAGMDLNEGIRMVQQTTRNYELTLASAVREANLLSTSLSRQDFQNFASNILARVRNQGVTVSDTGAIQLRSANPMLDSLVVPVRAETSAPLYQRYSDIVDIYRQNPLALPPEAYQLVRRSNSDIVNLAKTWEVLPPGATASNERVLQLRTARPEFGNTWGSPIDPNIGAPLRRVVEIPESSLMDTPEVSRMIGAQPPVTVDITANPVNQVPPPPDIEQTLRRIQSNYAREAERFADRTASNAALNRATRRMEQLRIEGAALIADYPEVAARMVADIQPTPTTPSLLEPATAAARADIRMRYEVGIFDDLQRQLGTVNARLQDQQRILDELPPLERRFLDSEIDTRRLSGENVPVRTVNTPSTLSNETVYVSARRQLFQSDALLPQNTGIDNDIRTIISSNSELSSIDPDEALELLRSSVELETFNAIDVDTGDFLDAADVNMDSLLEFNLDDFMIQITINNLPRQSVFNDSGDLMVTSNDGANIVLPRAQVFEAYENAKRNGTSYFDPDTEQLVIEPMPQGARYVGGGAYGQTYLLPDGTLTKRGSITTDEVRLQRKAAAQGVAPDVISELVDPGAAREFTMQFLEGYQPLSELRRTLSDAELASVRRDVYDTVDRLHQAGVVHNDLHAGNIMVNPDTLEVRVIDFGLATEDFTASRNSLTDYGYVATEFNQDTFYHGTHHTSRLSDATVFSLSNEFGPAEYLTPKLDRAQSFAKAYPAQDVLTTSMRTPRREQVGNVQAVILEGVPNIEPASAYRDNIYRSFVNELDSRGEAKLKRNFKAWVRNNDNPAQWWHYLRERYTDDRMTDLAQVQLGIRQRLIDEGVKAFRGVNGSDVVVIDPSIIVHRSIPHHVEGTGTVAEALAYRNAVDSDLVQALPNNTTRAIDAHNKLNMDTYIQNQLTAASTQQQREVLDSLQELHRQQMAHQEAFINDRSTRRAEAMIELERQTNTVVNMELRNLNDICL